MLRESLIVSTLLIAVPVMAAEPKSKIVPYPVEGRTASEVFTYIKTKSPRIAANATFAFTLPATKTNAKSVQGKDGCRFTAYKTSLFFAYYIPQHKSPKALPGPTRKKWAQFVSYLEDHERLHGENWTACIADFDTQAIKLKAKDCRALGVMRDKLFDELKRACVAKDEAIDVTFRKDVMQHPFLREAQNQQ
jgi:predicted secreted Zn-dependent protease